MLNKENPRLKIETMVYCNTSRPQYICTLYVCMKILREKKKISNFFEWENTFLQKEMSPIPQCISLNIHTILSGIQKFNKNLIDYKILTLKKKTKTYYLKTISLTNQNHIWSCHLIWFFFSCHPWILPSNKSQYHGHIEKLFQPSLTQ